MTGCAGGQYHVLAPITAVSILARASPSIAKSMRAAHARARVDLAVVTTPSTAAGTRRRGPLHIDEVGRAFTMIAAIMWRHRGVARILVAVVADVAAHALALVALGRHRR